MHDVELINYQWLSNPSFLSRDGWSYGVPMISSVLKVAYSGGVIPRYNDGCYWYSNYIFTDSTGAVHPLDLASVVKVGPETQCNYQTPISKNVGGDDYVQAGITQSSSTISVPPGVVIADHDGTVYSGGGISQAMGYVANGVSAYYGMPSWPDRCFVPV